MVSILFRYLWWQWGETPWEILKGWGNILKFNFTYFSFGALLKTFFSPWRQYKWSYGRGFDPGRYVEVFASNLISRILGALTRTFLLLIGLFVELLIFGAGGVFLVLWMVFPVLIVSAFLYGVGILL